MPFQSATVWQPSACPMPGPRAARHWSQDAGMPYYFHEDSREAVWAIPEELRHACGRCRILVFTADEGSTGWAAFQFLAQR
eukprot:3205991-Alexandrium_andersonii.AAC.1